MSEENTIVPNKPDPASLNIIKEFEKCEKERLVKLLMEDFPMCDRLMVESLVEKYIIDGDDKFNEFLANPPPKVERNTNYSYIGVTVD
jgi:hypothetical protein